MATAAQIKNFITILSKYAIKEYTRRKSSGQKWILPSVCIAQASLETGWGTSDMMVKAHAYFGIKAGTNWKGKVYSSKTKECYDGSTFTTITDLFRAYDSLEESVDDYYDLITSLGHYAFACNQTDSKTCIQAIWDGGYATDPDYVQQVMAIINQYNLTQYDHMERDEAMAKGAFKAVELATSREGKNQYTQSDLRSQVFGGYSDCSSLWWKAFEKAYGIQIGTWTGEQVEKGTQVAYYGGKDHLTEDDYKKLQVGDLIYFGSGEAKHVEGFAGWKNGVPMLFGHGSGTPSYKNGLTYTHSAKFYQARRFYTEESGTTSGSSDSIATSTISAETVAYVARMSKDTKTYVDAGIIRSTLWPELKKDTLVDVVKGKTIKDTAGKNWYLVRIGHPSEGFVREYVPIGSFRHLK